MTAAFPKPGERFEERYEILAHLASGGFSQIFHARQIGLEREVALKVLRPLYDEVSPADPDRWRSWSKRFELEARLVSQLRDPHTVTVHDYGQAEEGLWYIVFEFIDGCTVKEEIARGPVAYERVVSILLQVAQSLEEAHQLNVLHRDIKPANLMLYEHMGRPDRVKVLDFGIAKEAGEELREGSDLTSEGRLMGTPRYMTPEQIREEELTPASDLYSLGLVAYEMLAGQPAVTEQKTVAIIRRQVDDAAFVLPEKIDAPDWLRAIIAKMLAKEPGERFQSARALAEALEKGADGDIALGVDASAPEIVDPNVVDLEHSYGLDNLELEQGAELQAQAARQNVQDSKTRRSQRARLALDEYDPGQLSADLSRDIATPTEADADDTDKKLSALTMLGVEQMLERSERRGGRRWVLPAVAVVLLAAFLGGGYMLYLEFSDEASSEGVAPAERLHKTFVIPVSDWWAGDRDRFSTEGLQTVIKGAGWRPEGKPGIVETPGGKQVRQDYRRKRSRIITVVHDTPDRAAARKILERVELPARAILFDTKVVELRVRPGTDPEAMEDVLVLLRRYHEMIVTEE